MKHFVHLGTVLLAAAALAGPVSAQTAAFNTFNAAVGPFVRNLPYSGEGVTTVSQTLGDGTRIDQTTTAKVYRDSAGRERREQTVAGLTALNPLSASETLVTIFDPVEGANYTLDPKRRTARRMPLVITMTTMQTPQGVGRATVIRRAPADLGDMTFRVGTGTPPSGALMRAGPGPFSVQTLSAKPIDGVTATGIVWKTTIPVGQIGNDRPIEISDEQWTSTDLNVVVLSKHHDPRTGDVEYRLTNIIRAEPQADLFVIPSDYQVVGAQLKIGPAAPK
jgi:hypothetical protein